MNALIAINAHKVATPLCLSRRPGTATSGIVVHTLHKSASTFLLKFFQRLSRRQGFEFYSENLEHEGRAAPAADICKNFCWAPVRHLRVEETLGFAGVDRLTQVVQIRDPRDILVSQYYSYGWIHDDTNWSHEQHAYRKTIQQVSVDEYVTDSVLQNAEHLFRSFDQLMGSQHGRSDDATAPVVVRYEDMVLDFKSWARCVIRPFDYRFENLAASYLAQDYRDEFRPSTSSTSHKRRVIPGDYLEKLRPESIRDLNQRFEPILKKFGYLR